MPGGISLKDLTLTNASLAGGAVTVTGDFSWSVSQGQNVLNAPLTARRPGDHQRPGKKITLAS